MTGIGQIAPGEGMDILLIAQVAFGAGDLGDAAVEVAAMALGAGIDVGRCRRPVAARQPAGHVRSAAVGRIDALPVLIPATGERKHEQRGQPYPLDNSSYR